MTLSKMEQIFLVGYISTMLKSVKVERNTRKKMARLRGKISSSQGIIAFDRKNTEFMVNLCTSGAKLGRLRLKAMRTATLYLKIRRFCKYRKVTKGLVRIIAQHDSIAKKFKEDYGKRFTTKHSRSNARS